MNGDKPSLLQFPCEFPIKVFGRNQDGLDALVLAIVRSHAPDIAENAVSSRLSGGSKYTALTVTVNAQSQAQLDSIYLELSACPEIIMAL